MIPEFRALIEIAQKYLKGETHFSNVVTLSQEFLFYAKQVNSPKIRKVAEDWNQKALQVWDEWGALREEERITEAEYKEWVSKQLKVLNDEFTLENVSTDKNP